MKYDEEKSRRLMGRDPHNPIGSCFDSVPPTLFDWINSMPVKVCHAIGIATLPGQEGRVMAHAWLEKDGYAYDVIWAAKCPVEKYRADLNISYIVEYSTMEFMQLYIKTNYPGPWDPKILAITEKKDKERQ